MKLTLTSSQNLLLQGILGLLLSALLGAGNAALQYLLNGTHVNVGVALSVFLVSFAGAFGASLHQFIPGHAQQLIQSLTDAKTQLQQERDYWQQQAVQKQDIKDAIAEVQRQQSAQPQNVAQQVASQVAQVLQQHLPSGASQSVTTGPSLVNPLPVIPTSQNAATPVSTTLQGTVTNTVPPTIGFINPVTTAATSYVPSNNVTQLFSGDMSGANTMPRLQVVK